MTSTADGSTCVVSVCSAASAAKAARLYASCTTYLSANVVSTASGTSRQCRNKEDGDHDEESELHDWDLFGADKFERLYDQRLP